MVRSYATCIKVIDGDTFETNTNLRIRLARVYAPELDSATGLVAKNTLAWMIEGKIISYEISAFDDYGRAVCEVWLASLPINDWMRGQGYDKPQWFPPPWMNP